MAAPRGSTMYVRVMNSLYTKKMLSINYVSVPTYVVSTLCEAIWLKRLLKDLQVEVSDLTTIYG